MSLIAQEQDDTALLEAEDQAIADAVAGEQPPAPSLIALERILNGVHEASEGDSGAGRRDDEPEGG